MARKKKVSKRDRFRTGYENPELVREAIENGVSKGTNHKKRDKMNFGTRFGNGTTKQGNQRIGIAKSVRSTGVFLGVEAQEDDSYEREMRRIQWRVGEKQQGELATH